VENSLEKHHLYYKNVTNEASTNTAAHVSRILIINWKNEYFRYNNNLIIFYIHIFLNKKLKIKHFFSLRSFCESKALKWFLFLLKIANIFLIK